MLIQPQKETMEPKSKQPTSMSVGSDAHSMSSHPMGSANDFSGTATPMSQANTQKVFVYPQKFIFTKKNTTAHISVQI